MDDPTGYLYRTAMNAFRSWHRRSTLAAKRAFGLTRTDESITQIEEQDVVVRALASLTSRQRAAVELIDFMGYSSEEAGRMLGIRASTVRTHVERAHRDLKARVDLSHE
jgi:RNA polymerase sigma factor (sigma-70 family)